MEVSWGHVRQIILNDRVNGYKPDKAFLRKLSSYLPDVRVLGFGKYYEYHWYVVIESKLFPESIDPIATRGALPLSSVIKQLANRIPV